jgi:hypothetical protein
MSFYVLAFALATTPGSGNWSNLTFAAGLWLAGVALLVIGHITEGNLGSITPVLVCRLLSRKFRDYSAANRVHIHAS